MNVTINNTKYEVDDTVDITKAIPNYIINTDIKLDKRNNDIMFSNIKDANKCLYMIKLYIQTFIYALRNNNKFGSKKYSIIINDKDIALKEYNNDDSTGLFDICFSDKQIANNYINILKKQLNYDKTRRLL